MLVDLSITKSPQIFLQNPSLLLSIMTLLGFLKSTQEPESQAMSQFTRWEFEVWIGGACMLFKLALL